MQFLLTALLSLLIANGSAQLHPKTPAGYQTLPALREQAAILDAWRDERISHIPQILNRHNVDAWLVSGYIYHEGGQVNTFVWWCERR